MTKAVVLIGLLFATACTVGEVPLNGGGTDAGSGGGGGGSGSGGGGGGSGSGGEGSGSGGGSGSGVDPDVCTARATPLAAHDHGGGQLGRSGQACMTAACHGNGGPAPNFQLAGTVYKTGGTTVNPGVTIYITPATGPTQTAISDTAGDFYVYKGTIQNAFPAQVKATACPALTPMNEAVQANGGGNCNSCHTAGQQGPITLGDQ